MVDIGTALAGPGRTNVIATVLIALGVVLAMLFVAVFVSRLPAARADTPFDQEDPSNEVRTFDSILADLMWAK